MMKNILVVNVNWMGDVIFSTPVFRALKEAYPEARIFCMAPPRVVPVLRCCPAVDEIIVYDEKGVHQWIWGKIALIARLRHFHFDAAFLLHQSWTRAFMVYLGGAKERVGYDVKDLGRLLTHKVELAAQDIHRADYYLRVIESYGVEVKDRAAAIIPLEDGREQVKNFLRLKGITPDDFLVVVNAGGNWDLKRWPRESFALLVEHLCRKMKIKVVLTGAGKDIRLVDEIGDLSHVDPIRLAGKTSLESLFALMERADVVVSSDSGPLHVASAVGTETIAIFGPTRPEITGPRGRGRSTVLQKEILCNQRACYQLDCLDNQCMKAVSVDEVAAAVQDAHERWRAQGAVKGQGI